MDKYIDPIITRIKEEPVAVMAIIEAALAVTVVFGLALTTAQVAAVLGLAGAILTFIARQQVTPTVKLDK
jgi:uncharacterized membrane protein YphA (DoxX/SURF4 family)